MKTIPLFSLILLILMFSKVDAQQTFAESRMPAKASQEVSTPVVAPGKFAEARLYQSASFPFNQTAFITYELSSTPTAASIQFKDEKGRVVKEYMIEHEGAGSITLFAGDLTEGTYEYSLLIDNKVIETKKLLVTH